MDSHASQSTTGEPVRETVQASSNPQKPSEKVRKDVRKPQGPVQQAAGELISVPMKSWTKTSSRTKQGSKGPTLQDKREESDDEMLDEGNSSQVESQEDINTNPDIPGEKSPVVSAGASSEPAGPSEPSTSSLGKRAAPQDEVNDGVSIKRVKASKKPMVHGLGALLEGHVPPRPDRKSKQPVAPQQVTSQISNDQKKAIAEQLQKVEKIKAEVEKCFEKLKAPRPVSNEAQLIEPCQPGTEMQQMRNWGLSLAFGRLREASVQRVRLSAAVALFLKSVVSLKVANLLSDDEVDLLHGYMHELLRTDETGDQPSFKRTFDLFEASMSGLQVTPKVFQSVSTPTLSEPKTRVRALLDTITELVQSSVDKTCPDITSLMNEIETFEHNASDIISNCMDLRDTYRNELASVHPVKKDSSALLDDEKRNDAFVEELSLRQISGLIGRLRLALMNVVTHLIPAKSSQYQNVCGPVLEQLRAAINLQRRRKLMPNLANDPFVFQLPVRGGRKD